MTRGLEGATVFYPWEAACGELCISIGGPGPDARTGPYSLTGYLQQMDMEE